MSGPSIFPTSSWPARRIDPGLLRALAQAVDAVRAAATREKRRAHALAELGDIDLPDAAPTAEDAQHLDVIAPLYLAQELEAAGLLRTAELIAGLFASGAISEPLGPTAGLIAAFWKTRSERLSAAEREQLFAQVFEPQGFDPLMRALCDALTRPLVDSLGTFDVHARVAMQEAGESLGAWLAPHAVGMALFAADDILKALAQATHFLRDRMLQSAFGVHDLWTLLETVSRTQGVSAGQIRSHVELGRQGATVLAWLARVLARSEALDPNSAQAQQVIAAAEGWLLARSSVGESVRAPATTATSTAAAA
jgi:hypothetical protein